MPDIVVTVRVVTPARFNQTHGAASQLVPCVGLAVSPISRLVAQRAYVGPLAGEPEEVGVFTSSTRSSMS